ncbi:hypothetical protein HSRCO_0744 [Halanaeroarchaeum sp. HSR-CO]|uniref:hypothetical protein n=1 Tax=Halanaeroarchaeum sp. HSR-CO TaxID=2866382 RepID=UPI00217EED09|nr:hypothetical protein [Halanaeroarchaeum sp. HSR-CO]UWG47038.1 hypothetical protein HSRCO_0744 [Halanaeroarchaeum sp. HSR-CO]
MAEDDWIARASDKSPSGATKQGISALILAFFGIVISLGESFADGLAKVLGVLSDFRDLVATFFTSPEVILTQTAQYSADSLTVGDWAFFGPGTWAVGVASIALGFWVWTLLDPKIPFIDKLLPWR